MIYELAGLRAHRRPAIQRLGAVAVALFAVALGAAGCGGGSASPGVADANSTTATTIAPSAAAGNSGPPPSPKLQKAQLAYSECIRAHGITNFPDPLTGGGYPDGYMKQIDANSPTFETATKDCQALADSADMAPYTKAKMAAHTAAMLKIAKCMRAHGITGFPDPDANGGFSLSTGSPSSIDRSSLQYAAAAKACNGPPGAPPGSGSGVDTR